ncbi:MAG: Fic family protein [Acholeplasmataceae bacterium]
MKRSGKYVSNLKGSLSYQSFKPSNLPPYPNINIDDTLSNKIKSAYHLLGELNGISKFIPNRDLFISILIRKEALLSSQIEGNQATLNDIFDPNLGQNINNDIDEVIHYIKAYNYGKSLLKKLPISIRFIKEVHRELLLFQRGKDKEPGKLRRLENWIGPAGGTLKNAKFIPPNLDDIHESLKHLEMYIHNYNEIDPLLKIGLIHYQFETIHPFLDGNGRMGRLLILFLLEHYKLLDNDILYLSYYLKLNRFEYYERLMDVRLKGNYEAWLLFFIEGIIESANHAIDTIDALFSLKEKHLKLVNSLTGKQKQTALLLYDYITVHPIINITKASITINKSFNTVSNTVNIFINLGILVQAKSKKRNRTFIYGSYLDILRDGTN